MITGQNYRATGWDVFKAPDPRSEKDSQKRPKNESFENKVSHLFNPFAPTDCKGLVYLWAQGYASEICGAYYSRIIDEFGTGND